MLLIGYLSCCLFEALTQPQQVIIALTGKSDEVIVQWVTFNRSNSFVFYGISNVNENLVEGNCIQFVDPNPANTSRSIHNVRIARVYIE